MFITSNIQCWLFPHPHPYTWKIGQYKVRDYLNVTNWTNRYCEPIKNNYFLFLGLLEVTESGASLQGQTALGTTWRLYFIRISVYRSFYCCRWHCFSMRTILFFCWPWNQLIVLLLTTPEWIENRSKSKDEHNNLGWKSSRMFRIDYFQYWGLLDIVCESLYSEGSWMEDLCNQGLSFRLDVVFKQTFLSCYTLFLKAPLSGNYGMDLEFCSQFSHHNVLRSLFMQHK